MLYLQEKNKNKAACTLWLVTQWLNITICLELCLYVANFSILFLPFASTQYQVFFDVTFAEKKNDDNEPEKVKTQHIHKLLRIDVSGTEIHVDLVLM